MKQILPNISPNWPVPGEGGLHCAGGAEAQALGRLLDNITLELNPMTGKAQIKIAGVNKNHLLLGFGPEGINAANMPFDSETWPTVASNVQAAIETLAERNFIVRRKVEGLLTFPANVGVNTEVDMLITNNIPSHNFGRGSADIQGIILGTTYGHRLRLLNSATGKPFTDNNVEVYGELTLVNNQYRITLYTQTGVNPPVPYLTDRPLTLFIDYVLYSSKFVELPWDALLGDSSASSSPINTSSGQWRGIYSDLAYYFSGDLVRKDTATYAAKQDVQGVPPIIGGSDFWALVAKDGEAGESIKGDPGRDGNYAWKKQWQNTEGGYNLNDLVYWEGSTWISEVAENTAIPTMGSTVWGLFAKGYNTGASVSEMFRFTIGSGVTLAERIANTNLDQLPAGWSLAVADTAGIPSAGTLDTTLVINHQLGMDCWNVTLAEVITDGPDNIKGQTFVPTMNIQSDVRSDLGNNILCLNDLVSKTNAARSLKVILAFV